MGCSGVLFAVEEKVVEHIRSLPEEKRFDYITDELEEEYFEDYPERTAELGEVWEEIHLSLTDADLSLNVDCEKHPLGGVVLGGELLCCHEVNYEQYIISAKSPELVKTVLKHLERLSKAKFRKGYDRLDQEFPCTFSLDNFEPAWEHLQDAIPFFRNAEKKGLWVLFTGAQ